MMITALLLNYASWLLASAIFFWLCSVLYRTTWNTVNAAYECRLEEREIPVPQVAHIPARPRHKPRVPYSNAA
ncbi:hypothetical protein [Arthrobacter terrae]|nr:hypothetical protein [Arthrobacter terrae]